MHEPALPLRSPPELALAGRRSTDERLAQLVSRGSTRAFALLYRRHHQALYRYCCAIVRNANDAQDALQNAMLRALVAMQAEERDLAVRPWLFRIAHNEAVSLLRRRRSDTPLEDELEPSAASAEDAWELRERLATLLIDLQALTERQRSALVMRELSGLPIKEIAAALSISPGAAKQALFEARCALQEFDEGRAMECDAVRKVLSDGDRRVLHGRKIRAHLRSCRGCHDFKLTIAEREAAWSALAPPFPALAASAILARILAHAGNGGHAGGAAAASGIAIGKPGAASVAAKLLAGTAIVTVTATGGARLVLNGGSRTHAKPARAVAVRPSRTARSAGAESASKPSGSAAHARASGAARSALTTAASAGSRMAPISPAALSVGAFGRSSAGIHRSKSSASGRSLRGRHAAGRGQSRRIPPTSRAKPLPSHAGKPKPATARPRKPSAVSRSKSVGRPGHGATGRT